MFCIILFLPIVVISCNLDPFYYVFELFLPDSHNRTLFLIATLILIRFFLGIVCVFECTRFLSIILFIHLSIALTMLTCLRQLIRQPSRWERRTLKLYTQLRIILKIGDYFIRYVLLFALTCPQFIITTLWWLVLKCWHLLPVPITLLAFQGAVVTTLAVTILLPRQIEICSSSEKFVKRKTALHHTFNKYNKNRYYFLRWKSQRILPIRFGVQFTLNKSTPIGYLNVFITNLTNAVLLINP